MKKEELMMALANLPMDAEIIVKGKSGANVGDIDVLAVNTSGEITIAVEYHSFGYNFSSHHAYTEALEQCQTVAEIIANDYDLSIMANNVSSEQQYKLQAICDNLDLAQFDRMLKREMMIITRPRLDINDVAKTYKTALTEHGADVLKVDLWGLKRLAYEVKDEEEGLYLLFTFYSTAATVNAMDRLLKRDNDILRSMIITADYH